MDEVLYKTLWLKPSSTPPEWEGTAFEEWLFHQITDLGDHIAAGGIQHPEDLNISFLGGVLPTNTKLLRIMFSFHSDDAPNVEPLLKLVETGG